MFPADFPSNVQYEVHFFEFLKWGYKPALGNIEVRFPFAKADRKIDVFTVGYDDGMCKAIIMMAIVAFVKELEIDMSRDDGSLKMVLSSFRSIRCSYIYFENPRDHFLHSLRTLPHVDITLMFGFDSDFLKIDFCPGLAIHESYLRNPMGDRGETSPVTDLVDGRHQISNRA